PEFRKKFRKWIETGSVKHPTSHVRKLSSVKIPAREERLGEALAAQLMAQPVIMGIFDEGCMGMYNAIIEDALLNPCGVFKERLSQSALCHEVSQVRDDEANAVYQWYRDHGMKFVFGKDEENELTERQVLLQCKMYIAAVRIADDFGCSAIGIQYQQGLKDMLPASDLVEGTLNNTERPPVMSRDGKRELYAGRAIPNFNEVDECAGLDALLIHRVHEAMSQPIETTLHDVRWADWDPTGSVQDYVWVFEISGSVPPAHFANGWKDAVGVRQPKMSFPLGGSTIKGVSRPGEIIWSRMYVDGGRLWIDLGRGESVELPEEEMERRWSLTNREWPIMNAVTYGVSRDQFMAKHKANHIQVVYATGEKEADAALLARAAMAKSLGIQVNICGTRRNDRPWT
ncbi:MAG: fucose isomerase, partial [Planctomycetia bacterium]|nr:fucose isomerase [Planctomycetia bacterium]